MGDSEQPYSPVRPQGERRSWVPMAAGAALVVVIIAALALVSRAGRSSRGNGPTDPNLAKVQISNLHMSTAENFVGNSLTYIEGKIRNNSDHKVTAVRVEVLFKNSLGEVAQAEKALPLNVVLPNTPYVDYGPVDQAPLAPGQEREFRLTLEHVSLDWDRQLPQVRVVSLGY